MPFLSASTVGPGAAKLKKTAELLLLAPALGWSPQPAAHFWDTPQSHNCLRRAMPAATYPVSKRQLAQNAS